jgi:hypothetical protein
MIRQFFGITLAVTIVLTCGFLAYVVSGSVFYLLGSMFKIGRYVDGIAVGNVVVLVCTGIGLVIGVIWARSILTSK